MVKPVMITGAGIVSAIGCGKAETLDSLSHQRTGIGRQRYLQTEHREYPVGEVKLSDEEMKQLLGIDSEPTTRSILLGMLAVREALEEASLPLSPSKGRGDDIAFISGTTVGGMDKSERYYLDFLANDNHNEYIKTHDCGATTDMIADKFGIFSQVTSISTACSSAANAIIYGANLIRSGRADIAVVGGTESLSKFHFNGFNTLMILDPEQCRPFDATRAGLNLGEGAAYLVLESEASAKRRGVDVIGELSGYGNACDAFHQTASSDDGEGAYLAMTQALQRAGLQPQDISYVNAHGTGTPNNDVSESFALKRVFGDEMPQVSSTKGLTGHTTSASGSVEAVICLLAMRHDLIPVNYGWAHQIEGGIKPATDPTPLRPLDHVMSNAFGFGGNDSSIILSRHHA
jgi:3-oxoacyl-(acyl-carrier-protein) synthase